MSASAVDTQPPKFASLAELDAYLLRVRMAMGEYSVMPQPRPLTQQAYVRHVTQRPLLSDGKTYDQVRRMADRYARRSFRHNAWARAHPSLWNENYRSWYAEKYLDFMRAAYADYEDQRFWLDSVIDSRDWRNATTQYADIMLTWPCSISSNESALRYVLAQFKPEMIKLIMSDARRVLDVYDSAPEGRFTYYTRPLHFGHTDYRWGDYEVEQLRVVYRMLVDMYGDHVAYDRSGLARDSRLDPHSAVHVGSFLHPTRATHTTHAAVMSTAPAAARQRIDYSALQQANFNLPTDAIDTIGDFLDPASLLRKYARMIEQRVTPNEVRKRMLEDTRAIEERDAKRQKYEDTDDMDIDDDDDDVVYGYAYVPRDQIASILAHGYLSVRQQALRLPEQRQAITNKYIQQYNAERNDPDFVAWQHARRSSSAIAPTEFESILDYLDWRDVHTLRGASAIYFMFAPVPNDAHLRTLIREQRHGFLDDDRVLIRFKLPTGARVFHVSPDAGMQRDNEEYWKRTWYASLGKHANDANVLWLEDIPHAYIVPESGMIDASVIEVV